MTSENLQASKSKIKIKFNETIVNVFIENNRLKKNILKEYFPEGGTLIYELDGEQYLLNSDNEYIYLNNSVDMYNLRMSQDSTPKVGVKRSKQYREMLQDLYGTQNDEGNKNLKRKISEEKIANKNQKQKIMKPIELPFVKRVIYVGWKHRKDIESEYRSMGPAIGPKIKVQVNANEDYSLDVLKQILLKEYVNESNENYFTNSKVDIGTFSCTIINSLEHEGKIYGFWDFIAVKKMRTSNHILHLYLLTSKMKHLVATNDLPHCSSVKIDKKNETANKSLILNERISTKNILNYVDLNVMPTIIDANKKRSKKVTFCNIITESETVTDCNVPEQKKPVLSEEKMQLATVTENNLEVISEKKIIEEKSEKKNETSFKSECIQSLEKDKWKSSFDSDDFTPRARKKTLHYMDVSIKFIDETKIKFSNTILGRGGQGVVYKGKYLGSIVAIKSMQKSTHDKLVLREILLLDKIRHPNIINIMAACLTKTQIHIVMEYFKGDSLFDIIFDPEVKKKYSFTTLKKNQICYKIASALTFLHLQSTPILHRDVKPGNILVNKQFDVKVCDLGLAKSKLANESLKSTQVNTMRGTYLYMAPEILLHQKEASKASDVWAFACTTVELYSEKEIMDVQNYFNGWLCAKNHLDVKYVPSVTSLPFYLQKKFSECFQYDPNLRPEMSELLQLFPDADYN